MHDLDNPSPSKGMLNRKRISSLIEKGIQHPLLVILAEPGYGKTQAMASYLAQSDNRFLWVRVGDRDNAVSHFWDYFIHALKDSFPSIHKRVSAIDFPNTSSRAETFLQILREEIGKETKKVVWVFDDYNRTADSQLKPFFRALAELGLDNFSLVLISNAVNQLNSIAFLSPNPSLILGKDLKFTQDEIEQLYALHNVHLGPNELDALEEYTEGWALPLYLFLQQEGDMQDKTQQIRNGNDRSTHHMISHMFQSRYFNEYPPEHQKLILELSLLNYFTDDLAIRLYEGDKTDIEALRNHEFMTMEVTTGRLSFHNLYQMHLQRNQYLLEEEDKMRVWRIAADYSAENDDLFNALAYYRKCGDHARILEMIVRFITTHFDYTAEDIAYLIEHLNLLTPEEYEQYPLAAFLHARFKVNLLELEEAEELAYSLKERLVRIATPEALELLGDVYYLLGVIRMIQSHEDFGNYFRSASDYLPNGSNFQTQDNLYSGDSHSFSMPDNQPFTREKMVEAVRFGVPWMNKVLNGGASGLDYVFASEADYLSFHLDESRKQAYQAIYKAERNAQHDLVCNSYCILARIAFLQGDHDEVVRMLDAIDVYVSKHSDVPVIKEIRDTAYGWYYVKTRDLARVPLNILALGESDNLAFSRGRPIMVYANYLLNTGEYAKLAGMFENPHTLTLSRGIWADRICLFIMLSISYYKLGDTDTAIKALWTAYNMCYLNDLVAPFIEAEAYMCELIELVGQQTEYIFDTEWLDRIETQAREHAKRAAAFRASYQRKHPEKSFAPLNENPLTKRETEILEALASGMTREEIASAQFISINTVKTFLRSIYTKLNVSNRVEAISVAISKGYLDSFKDE